ncbi:hypothetical protein BT69DRAFT_1349839 [Atractiella rhizophila]|nr:hypothetical protein BT69DRAFT_1349839 [Atractiella rhizophila]
MQTILIRHIHGLSIRNLSQSPSVDLHRLSLLHSAPSPSPGITNDDSYILSHKRKSRTYSSGEGTLHKRHASTSSLGSAFNSPLHAGAGRRRNESERLRKRLVQSLIVCSLPASEQIDAESTRSRRDSASSIGTGTGTGTARRKRTPSSNLNPSSSSATSEENLSPFWSSSVHVPSVDPDFWIEEKEKEVFLEGLAGTEGGVGREERIVVDLWIREVTAEEGDGKGKGRQVQEEEHGWKLMERYNVNLSECRSLGREPSRFPSPMPPNTLLLQISSSPSSTNTEWFVHIPPSPQDDNVPASTANGMEEEDEEALSDPGQSPRPPRRRARAHSHLKEMEETRASFLRAIEKRERELVLERSAYETRMLSSYDMEGISGLIEGEKSLEASRFELADAKRKLEEVLCGDGGKLEEDERERGERRERLKNLEDARTSRQAEIERRKQEIEERRNGLKGRKKRLEKAQDALRVKEKELEVMEQELNLDQGIWESIRLTMRHRSATLVQQLSDIYPIIAIPPTSPDPKFQGSLDYSVLNLPLPNSPFPPAAYSNDDVLSSALGYVAQLTLLLSTYLGVPIHYPLKPMGSRSLVMDPISSLKGQRWFPLYGKGVDRYRFDYAVFLLNKDVEQLLYSQKLQVKDLRNTLPNLAALSLSITCEPDTPSQTPTPSRHDSGSLHLSIPQGVPFKPPRSPILQLNGTSSHHSSPSSSSSAPRSPSPSASSSSALHSSPTASSSSTRSRSPSPPARRRGHARVRSDAPSPELSPTRGRQKVLASPPPLSLATPVHREPSSSDDELRSTSPASTVRAGANGRSGSIKSIRSFISGGSERSVKNVSFERESNEEDEKKLLVNGDAGVRLNNGVATANGQQT